MLEFTAVGLSLLRTCRGVLEPLCGLGLWCFEALWGFWGLGLKPENLTATSHKVFFGPSSHTGQKLRANRNCTCRKLVKAFTGF